MNEKPQPQSGTKRPVSPPRIPLPVGAWDCHAHVFGPFDKFPVLAERRYDPPLAPAEDYLAMLDTVGFENGVIVHASAKGFDMSNVADALARRADRLIGVAVVSRDADDAEFEKLHQQGFRAVRFTENGGHVGRSPGTLYFDDLDKMAPKLRELGWHAQVWGRCDLIMGNSAALANYDIPIMFDHLGYAETEKGVGDTTFQSFLEWLPAGDFWVKTTPIRISKAAPDYPEAKPFYEALLKAVPDRIVFGSDWPYLSLDESPPDVGHLIDLLDEWTGDETLRQKIFVDNPLAFYRR
ncbi:amidohydrolase family protein [Microvirga alba]|uniref:Amidohydrolase family protein n=1 Tax=Microvirga alba TaxID=2791025 RepID=A0A931BM99_9HYPH|nr:amidohydrolase family protein [Microvirga alba]MBF9233851.1 amidohydrolase family protein [Microvirga alba]